MQEISAKPYLLRALYEWCVDCNYTPYIAVRIDNCTRVPREFVCNNEIVLNISFAATNQLQMGNELIEFHARFSGKLYKIEVPVANVFAIYAQENGRGVVFSVDALIRNVGENNPALSLKDEAYEAQQSAKKRQQTEDILAVVDNTGDVLNTSSNDRIKDRKSYLKLVK